MDNQNYYLPQSMDELYSVLDKESKCLSEMTFMAGGTDLLVAKDFRPLITDLSCIEELKKIQKEQDTVSIGSMTVHADIAKSDLVQRYCSVLSDACSQIGGPQLRNRGTIGGNLANASPAGDTFGPLAALNASLLLDLQGITRTVSPIDFIRGPGETVLQAGEIIREIRIPKWTGKGAFIKIGRRNALAISRLTVTVLVNITGKEIQELRIALGSVFAKPMRIFDLEKEYKGIKLDEKSADKIAKSFSEKIPEYAGIRPSTVYKQTVSRLTIRRMLLSLVRDTEGECV